MIKIDNVEVHGIEAAVRGMRNPLNSWDRSDSERKYYGGDCYKGVFTVGKNDLELMKKLVKAGTDHRKFMRMIVVYLDITAPLYWWKEYDTYKVGTVANSCSTMHKIADKEFTLEDFSFDWIPDDDYEGSEFSFKKVADSLVEALNYSRDSYNLSAQRLKTIPLTDAEKKHISNQKKRFWYTMIQLLPSSYNQKRTVMLNYEVLANMYKVRKYHKLDEWRTFCDWLETLPYSELITG